MTPVPPLVLSAWCSFPTIYGPFQLQIYRGREMDGDTAVLVAGDVAEQTGVLVRLHSECLTGDSLRSDRCDCGHQLSRSMQLIATVGRGIIVYLRQEGRGIGLIEKVRAYNLQDSGHDTIDANLLLGHLVDQREYVVAASVLRQLRIKSARLITNNTLKVDALREAGITVSEVVVLPTHVSQHNLNYLRTKRDRLGHSIDLDRFFPTERLEKSSPYNRRPWITLSYAQMLDGSIMSSTRQQLLISGPISRRQTHELRALHDGILVGIGTILADDPQLTVRHAAGNNPRPVVLDSALRIPVTARVLHQSSRPVILCTEDVSVEKSAALHHTGATICRLPSNPDGRVPLELAVQTLFDLGLRRIMVEGGQEVIGSFLKAGLVDECVVTIAPKFVGGIPALVLPLPEPLPTLEHVSIQILGGDLVIHGLMSRLKTDD